jgi:toxin YoeB
MGKYLIDLSDEAKEDLKKHKKAGNKAVISKITQIFEDLENHPYIGVGQPEKLKYELAGKWSRRINKKDRIIYSVNENIVTVFVLSAMGHYSDK